VRADCERKYIQQQRELLKTNGKIAKPAFCWTDTRLTGLFYKATKPVNQEMISSIINPIIVQVFLCMVGYCLSRVPMRRASEKYIHLIRPFQFS